MNNTYYLDKDLSNNCKHVSFRNRTKFDQNYLHVYNPLALNAITFPSDVLMDQWYGTPTSLNLSNISENFQHENHHENKKCGHTCVIPWKQKCTGVSTTMPCAYLK